MFTCVHVRSFLTIFGSFCSPTLVSASAFSGLFYKNNYKNKFFLKLSTMKMHKNSTPLFRGFSTIPFFAVSLPSPSGHESHHFHYTTPVKSLVSFPLFCYTITAHTTILFEESHPPGWLFSFFPLWLFFVFLSFFPNPTSSHISFSYGFFLFSSFEISFPYIPTVFFIHFWKLYSFHLIQQL